MPQILVRDLETEVVKRLKERAARHGRSLQGEVKALLTEAAGLDVAEARHMLKDWHKRFAGRSFPRSQDVLAEDRDR